MRELQMAVIREEIVDDISHVTIFTLLRRLEIKPHRWHYWLNSNDPEFDTKMFDIVNLYLQAQKMMEEGIKIFCTDEKSGIQVLSRKALSKPMIPGKVELVEHEYKRHGTACLTASFNVATGKVFGQVTSNRPAPVFAQHIEDVCIQNKDAKQIHFVVDNLNTHYHDDVCKVVAQQSGLKYEPFKEGVERKNFLKDKSKRVVFHFTPIHGSWLNQIEIWFGIMAGKVLRRGIFKIFGELAQKIVDYIEHWNNLWAHPFAWTYTGHPLKL